MPRVADHLYEAYQKTFQASPNTSLDPATQSESPSYAADYLANLAIASEQLEPPQEPDMGEDFAYAVLNHHAPLAERRQHANRAIDNAKAAFIAHAPNVESMDLQQAFQRADALSRQLVSGVTEAAANYPASTNTKQLQDSFMELLNPNKKTKEDTAVAAMAMIDIFQPYIVDRMLELDIYNPTRVKEQMQQLQADAGLLLRFYNSISHAVEFSVEGKTDLSEAQIADKLFDIGPIFTQLGQSLTSMAKKAGNAQDASFIEKVGKAMQEGVAMPDEDQQTKLRANLPEGLSLDEVFSSAKIAYVARTTSGESSYATKIKRPGIEQAISDNSRMFQLVADILTRYIETHAGEGTLTQQLDISKKALPFLLRVMERDMQEELDFKQEADRQSRGQTVYSADEDILVPDVLEKYSNDSHITMELIPGQRIEEVPANANYLKNLMVFLLRGRKHRYLHGDMHGGNIKVSNELDGKLVAYDWGKSIEIPKGFERNLMRFVVGALRKNPRSIAKAYVRIQSPNFEQANLTQSEEVAREVLRTMQVQSPATDKESKFAQRKIHETQNVLRSFVAAMGIRHQSTLDTNYLTYMRSVVSLATIAAAELAKPQYAKRSYKAMTILKSAAAAVRKVYFSKSSRRLQ